MVLAFPAPTSYDDAMLPPLADAPMLPFGPKPPRWYTKPSRPDLADVLAAAEDERAAHANRVAQGYRMLQRMAVKTEHAAYFKRLQKKVGTGEVERVALPGLRDETDHAATFAAQMDWIYRALYRSSLDREKAAAKEDLCVYLAENAQRQYSLSGGTSLKGAKAYNLFTFGCVAEFTGIDVDNEECGLRMRLLDPQTIYPVWEGERGLACVYSRYRTTASDFIGTFGSLDDFDESAVRTTAKGSSRTYDPHYLGEVVEYWDRNWGFLSWDDNEVLVFEHEYAEVPIVVTPGNFGQPINVSTPDLMRGSAMWSADRAEDLMRVYEPFLERRVAVHELEEATAGILATMVRRSQNPSVTVKAGVLTYEDEKPERSTDEGHINLVRAEDEVELDVLGLDPQVAAAYYAVLQGAKATSTPSSVIAGQAPMSQGSGTALNVLARAGAERWMSFVNALEHHETMVMEQRLRFLRDWGNLLGMDGVIYVPRRGRLNPRVGQSAAHEVTTDLLKETGIRVEVTMRHFNQSELASLGQGVAMLRSINMISRHDGIDLIGYTDDPQQALEDIDREMLNEVPEIASLNAMDTHIDDIEEAGWRGDEEAVERLAYRLMYLASRVDTEANTREAEQNQAKQMNVSTMMSPSVNGMSLPDFGIQPGTEGGRPPGAAGPQGPPAVPTPGGV